MDIYAKRDEETWCVPIVQNSKRPRIEVIVVVVRQNDDMDRGQILQRERRRNLSLWPDKLERPHTFRPDRVGDDGQVRELDQNR